MREWECECVRESEREQCLYWSHTLTAVKEKNTASISLSHSIFSAAFLHGHFIQLLLHPDYMGLVCTAMTTLLWVEDWKISVMPVKLWGWGQSHFLKVSHARHFVIPGWLYCSPSVGPIKLQGHLVFWLAYGAGGLTTFSTWTENTYTQPVWFHSFSDVQCKHELLFF